VFASSVLPLTANHLFLGKPPRSAKQTLSSIRVMPDATPSIAHQHCDFTTTTVEKEKQETAYKQRLAEEARERAELAVCRRLELEAKLGVGHFAKAEPDSKRPRPEPAATGDSDSTSAAPARDRVIKLEVLEPVDFIVDPGVCDREPCRSLARHVESRPLASTYTWPKVLLFCLLC
jgi:hypothetical protein